MSDDMNHIIEEDRKNHPGCGYSISTSNSYSSLVRNSLEDDAVWNIVRQIQRHCPNEKTKTIYSFTNSDSKYPHRDVGYESNHFEEFKKDNIQPLSLPVISNAFHNLSSSDAQRKHDSKREHLNHRAPLKGRHDRLPIPGEIIGPGETI